MAKHTLTARQLIEAAGHEYQQQVLLAQSFFDGSAENPYRVGVCGNTPLSPSHPMLVQARYFGAELARLGVGIVISTAEEFSFAGQAAVGFRDHVLKNRDRGIIIATVRKCDNQRMSWLGRGQWIKYYAQEYAPFEMMSGFISDLAAVIPTRDSYAEVMELWQRGQLALKIALQHGIENVPLGLRLRNSAIVKGWEPLAICAGEDDWSFLANQRDTYLRHGTISADRNEGRFVCIQHNIDAALHTILERALAWCDLFSSAEPTRGVNISAKALLRMIRTAQSNYMRVMKLLSKLEDGYYRAACFGSHYLPENDPCLGQAEDIGYFFGSAGIDLLEGNAGETSVMGRFAIGHHRGRSEHSSNGRSIGIGVHLPWENSQNTRGLRHKTILREALQDRVNTFLKLLTTSVATKGGVGTGLEEAYLLRESIDTRRGNCKAHGGTLVSRSVEKGWLPPQYAIGDDDLFGWRREFLETMCRYDLNRADGEDDAIRFVGDVDELKFHIDRDRKAWRRLASQKGLAVCN